MPLSYPDRHDRRAPRLPPASRSCSTSPTSAPCASRAPTPSTAAARAHQRSRTRSRPGRAQYTHLLDEADASVLDDIIVWWHPATSDVFDVMPNASNTDRVRDGHRRQRHHARSGRARRAGPARPRSDWPRSFPDAAAVGRFRVATLDWEGVACVVAGTGYTGEGGVEIAVPGGQPPICGRRSPPPASPRPGSAPATRCASRPACRCTATSSGPGITPLQAGLGGSWRGRSPSSGARRPLEAERAAGVAPPADGHRHGGPPAAARRVRRCWSTVKPVGVVTSGNFSPMLGHGIALAFVPPDAASRARRSPIDVRGSALAGAVVATPFVATLTASVLPSGLRAAAFRRTASSVRLPLALRRPPSSSQPSSPPALFLRRGRAAAAGADRATRGRRWRRRRRRRRRRAPSPAGGARTGCRPIRRTDRAAAAGGPGR